MHIFIDESGSFQIPKVRKGPSVSCIGALIVPEAHHDQIVADFQALTRDWQHNGGEIKGKLLNEPEISASINMMSEYGVMFECIAIDLGLHTTPEILSHKKAQAENLTKNLTIKHKKTLVDETIRYQAIMNTISIPEYVHMVMLTMVCRNVLEQQVNWFAKHAPREIGTFRWTIDAKDANARERHRMEKLWSVLSPAFLESGSIREPIIVVQGDAFDYSAHARFDSVSDEPPSKLRAHSKDWKPGQPYHYSDVRMQMSEHQQFADSKHVIGLQMVDVITSAARRMMNGNLKFDGWKDLGRMMIKPIRGNEVVRLVKLHKPDRRWKPDPPYNAALRHLSKTALRIIGE